jgi:prenyl protein peptidase
VSPPLLRPLQVLFQFTYTTIFGWYATYLFLRTGHLLAPVLVHALCNSLGLPPVVAMAQHRQRLLMLALLLGGAASFAWLLQPLTRPGLYL